MNDKINDENLSVSISAIRTL